MSEGGLEGGRMESWNQDHIKKREPEGRGLEMLDRTTLNARSGGSS